MLETKRVWSDDSYRAQHEEYETKCYCSECGKYLGSTNFTYKVVHFGELDPDEKFCKYCGAAFWDTNTQGTAKKPKDKEEVEKFIFDSLKAEYGDSVLSEKASKTIVIDTDTSYHGCSDVWISLEYFH